MKLLILIAISISAAAAAVPDQTDQKDIPNPVDDCYDTIKCDRMWAPFVAQNGCQCKVFYSNCDVDAHNAYYAPEYTATTKVNLQYCTCYATPQWLQNPISSSCSYYPINCLVPVNCVDEGYKPITASNGCECKIFRNRCDMQKFNCVHTTSTGEFHEIGSDECVCKYKKPTIIAEPIEVIKS